MITESRRLIQKLFLLGILVSCLSLMTIGMGTKAFSTDTKDTALPCCSVCDEDPTIPICRHGCLPNCRAKH